MALTRRKKINEMKKTRRHDEDTGSPEAQIAILTRRINELTKHLRKHRKDRDSRKGLLQLVEQRRKLIRYLRDNEPEAYNRVAEELELKKIEMDKDQEEGEEDEEE